VSLVTVFLFPSSLATIIDIMDNAALNGVAYDVIPDNHPSRTLVLCFDGTGDCFDADVSDDPQLRFEHVYKPFPQNSNVVQLFSMLQKDDKNQQMTYYQVCIFLDPT